MTTEVTSIGVGMETDGVERGIRTLQQLSAQGPRVEKSMQGIEAAASNADKSLKGFGEGSDKGLKAIVGSASGAEQSLGRVGKSAEETKRYIDNLHRSITEMGTIQTAPLTRGLDSVKTSATDASKAVDMLKSALAVTGIGIGAREVIAMADGYKQFTSQIKLATEGATEYQKAMADVRRISFDAQQGIEGVGSLYARISTSTKELGISQTKVAEITETVSLAFKAGSTNAANAASTMLQLSQAFGSGVLRGDEFNSVMESSPRLMKALADGMGVPIGALREMASEGKITAAVLAEALPKGLEKLRSEAAGIETIGGSFTALRNKIVDYVGAADSASGATKAISTSITGLANNLDTIAVAAGGLALILAGRYVGAMAAASASTAAMAVSNASANIAAVALAASMSPAAAAVSAFGIAARGASTAVLGLFGGPWGLAITAIGAATAAFLYFRDTTEETIKSIGGLNQPLDDLKKKLDDLPPEKRVSVIIDIEKSGREAIKQADSDIEALVQSVAGAANIKMPLDEFEKLTDSIRDTAKSGGDLTPILQKAAQSGGIPQSVLQSWLNLAANIREAKAAAGQAQAIANAAPKVEIMGPTIAQRDAQAQRDAAEALKGAAAYKSKAEQMAEVRSQGDKLRAALGNLTATNQGTSKAAEELRTRLVGVDERLESMAKSGKSAAGGAKQVENAYGTLSKRVNDYIEQLRIEAIQTDKATVAQKAQIQLDDLLAKSKGKVSAAKIASLKADIQTARAMEEEAKAVKRAVDAYQDYIRDQEAIARADVELSKAKEALWKSIAEQNIELENQSRMLELEASNIGKSAYERTLANEVLKAQIELEKELRDISNNTQYDAIAKDEAEASARARAMKKIALAERRAYVTEWEKTSQIVGQTLQDYIMGGGKDAAQYLKRLFSTLVLQPIVQTTVDSVFGQGASGVSGVASSAGGIGKLASTASNVNTLLGLSGSGAAFGSLGVSNAVGMAGGDALGALISTNATNWGVTAGSSLMGAIGTALPWVAGGLAIASLFGGDLIGSLFGRKLKDSGIEGTFGGDQGFTGNTFEFYKGGVFRSDKTVRNPLEEGTRSQFADLFTGAQSAIKTMGDTLGLITGAVDSATYSIKLSLKGLSEDDAAKAIQAEFDRITESMASLVLTTNDYSLADEKRIETLTRLSSSLTAFNGSLDQLGLAAYDASLKSADAAYKIISAFGGLENYGQALQSYYQNFYSEAEQLAKITETVTSALGQYGAKLPETAEAYRAMVEAQLLAAQYGDDKAAEFAAALIGMSGGFKLISDAWKKELDGMADSIASVFSGIKDEISSVLADVAGTRKDILRGTGAMTAAEIQAAINAALVYAPSTAGVARAQGATSSAVSSVASAKAISDRSAAEYAARMGAVNSAGANLAFGEAQKTALEKQARELTDWINSLWDGGANSGYNYGKRKKWSDDAAAQLEEVNRAISAMNPNLAKMREEVARQQAIADQAGKVSQADADRLDAAKAALDAAQKDEVKAKAEYASQLNKFVQDASGSVSKLSDLRGEVVGFYEAQVQAVEAMLQSAGNLRNVVDTVRLGQLTTAQTARELGNRYAMDYSMALSTTGTTRAGYVDAMASNLQSLTQAIKAEAISSSDYQIQTAKLLAQASNAAGLLEGDAETQDFQGTALDLLDSIDAALKNLEATTKTGEQIIADAVYNGTASTLNGLRAVVAALKGDPIPAFAVGTNYVPRDMLAQIHEGEAIVPKAFNPWAGGGMPASGGGNSKQLEVLMEQLIDEQRVQAARQVELQMQMNKQLQRWDAIGMPEVREV